MLPSIGRLEVASPLLVDRFEVTRGLWREVAQGHPELTVVPERWRSRFGDEDLPATHCSLSEAQSLAVARGMRLPDVKEWTYIATGSTSLPWPWGQTPRLSAVNSAELELARILPVGTFETGATEAGVYDLIGNVWEWALGPLPHRIPYASLFGPPPSRPREVDEELAGLSEEEALSGGSEDPPAPSATSSQVPKVVRALPIDAFEGRRPHLADQQIMGGSYAWRSQPIWKARYGARLNARGVPAEYYSADTGLRCVVDAEEYLRREAPRWAFESMREDLVAIGRRWGAGAQPLLERLVQESESPRSLAWLLEGASR